MKNTTGLTSFHHHHHHHAEKAPSNQEDITLTRMMQQELFEDSTNDEEDIDGEETLAPSSPPSLTSEDIFYAMMNGEAIHSIVDDQKYSKSKHTAITNVPIDTSSKVSKSQQVVDVFDEFIIDEKNGSCLHRPTSGEKGKEHTSDPTDNDEYGEDDLVGAHADACWASHSNADRFDATEEDEDGTNKDKGSFRAKQSSIFYQFAHQVRTQHELRAKAEKFRDCVDIRDRTYKLTLHKSCFIGSEAVDAMIYTGLATTREEAVTLGRQLAKELNLFKHVSGRHIFKDEYLFYRFRGEESTSFQFATSSQDSNSLPGNITDNDGDDYDDDNDNVEDGEEVQGGQKIYTGSSKGLVKMASLFRKCVDVKDRRFRMKTYKQCFVGSEAVDILVNTRLASTRKDAVQLGRTLARELGLFSHVTGDHAFCDDYLFFRFHDAGVKQDKRVLPITLATL